MSDDVLKKKKYPSNYASDVLNIIDAMAYNSKNVVIAGSMSYQSQQYAADYDLFEKVVNTSVSKKAGIRQLAKGLQKNVRELLKIKDCYIGDIKCGEIPEWKVIEGDIHKGKVIGFDAEKAKEKLKDLVLDKVISPKEAASFHKMIVPNPSVVEWLQMAKEIKPNIMRWSVKEILQGFKVLGNGMRFTLEQGITSPGLCKIDVVAYISQNHFTDFSCIYAFYYKETPLNPVKLDPKQELKKNIVALEASGDYYKMAKRMFSFLKFNKNNLRLLNALSEMFNGDLGRLYSIISDIGTLLFLLENESVLPVNKIKYEIGQFRSRLGNIFETDRVNTNRILDDIMSLETAPRESLVKGLEALDTKFSSTLNREAREYLTRLKLLPLKASFKP